MEQKQNFKKAIKLFFYEPQFYVNEDKETVVCVLGYEVFSDAEEVELLFANDSFGKVKGVAKCSKDDVFDLKTGYEIAQAKAEMKAYAAVEKKVSRFLRYIGNMSRKFEAFVEKAENVKKYNTNYIERLVDGTQD